MKTQLSPELNARGIVFLHGDQLGREFIVQQQNPAIQRWLDEGYAILAREWEVLVFKGQLMVTNIAACMDHFRLEVLGKGEYKVVTSFITCEHCGADKRKDGKEGPLQRCKACNFVRYCGAECQKADWPNHKEGCGRCSSSSGAKSNNSSATSNNSKAAESSGNEGEAEGSSTGQVEGEHGVVPGHHSCYLKQYFTHYARVIAAEHPSWSYWCISCVADCGMLL